MITDKNRFIEFIVLWRSGCQLQKSELYFWKPHVFWNLDTIFHKLMGLVRYSNFGTVLGNTHALFLFSLCSASSSSFTFTSDNTWLTLSLSVTPGTKISYFSVPRSSFAPSAIGWGSTWSFAYLGGNSASVPTFRTPSFSLFPAVPFLRPTYRPPPSLNDGDEQRREKNARDEITASSTEASSLRLLRELNVLDLSSGNFRRIFSLALYPSVLSWMWKSEERRENASDSEKRFIDLRQNDKTRYDVNRHLRDDWPLFFFQDEYEYNYCTGEDGGIRWWKITEDWKLELFLKNVQECNFIFIPLASGYAITCAIHYSRFIKFQHFISTFMST